MTTYQLITKSAVDGKRVILLLTPIKEIAQAVQALMEVDGEATKTEILEYEQEMED